jgi:DNA-binding NtrC family response regulator
MSNFVTLLVEDDAFQREAFADLLKDEGFEVIECITAEAAELIIASTGTELQALITDQHLAGAMSGAQLAQYARRRHPHMNIIIYVRQDCGAYTSQHHVLTKALLCRAVARSSSRLKSVRASLQRSRAYRTPSVTPPTPCGQRRLNLQSS